MLQKSNFQMEGSCGKLCSSANPSQCPSDLNNFQRTVRAKLVKSWRHLSVSVEGVKEKNLLFGLMLEFKHILYLCMASLISFGTHPAIPSFRSSEMSVRLCCVLQNEAEVTVTFCVFTQTSGPAAETVLEPDVKHHNGESCANRFEEDGDLDVPALLER